jgi:monofunctional glycosyltransferase
MFGVGPRNGAALQAVAETEQAPAGAGVGGRPPMSFARILRRVVRLILGIALLWGLAVLLLGLAYRVVPPVSTLMVGRWLTGAEVRRNWTDLKGISRQLPLAVIASEDSRFCLHEGVDWDALWSVIEAADGNGPSRGASTIAMQTAKNLFLWPSRSYVRKGLELSIALYLDLVWPKQRVIAVYLNIAEWGEGVFGAEAAARTYFRKSAAQLTRREAALLATALPNPLARNPARPSAQHRAIAARVLQRMNGTPADCLSPGSGLRAPRA